MNRNDLRELIATSREWEEYLCSLADKIENLDPEEVWESRKDIGRQLRTASVFARQVRNTVRPLAER